MSSQTEAWDDTACVVNTLISKFRPWFTLEFLSFHRGMVVVKIGSHVVEATSKDIASRSRRRVLLRVEVRHCIAYAPNAEEPTHFLKHLNGILAGKVRNDAGELVSA